MRSFVYLSTAVGLCAGAKVVIKTNTDFSNSFGQYNIKSDEIEQFMGVYNNCFEDVNEVKRLEAESKDADKTKPDPVTEVLTTLRLAVRHEISQLDGYSEEKTPDANKVKKFTATLSNLKSSCKHLETVLQLKNSEISKTKELKKSKRTVLGLGLGLGLGIPLLTALVLGVLFKTNRLALNNGAPASVV